MSLLMDALKKAEREKTRTNATNSHVDNIPEQTVSLDDASITTEQKISQLPDLEATDDFLADNKDESWAFDSGELELEPIAQKLSESLDKIGLEKTLLDEDATLIEPLPLENDLTAAMHNYESNTAAQAETESHKSDFDHDATLPSERAIQSSLKDYFEASQSITLDKNSINSAVDATTPSSTTTSPLDNSATHVTAHTIFTAGQTRPMSTGLGKYAMFGTLALGLGLGSVALYYSYVTPKVITMPTDMASVANMVEPEKRQTANITPTIKAPLALSTAKEATIASVEIEDAVLAEVVEELPTVDEPISEVTDIEQIQKTKTLQASNQAIIEAPIEELESKIFITSPEQQIVISEEPIIIDEPKKVVAAVETEAAQPKETVTTTPREIVYHPSNDQTPKFEKPKETITYSETRTAEVLTGGYNQPVIENEKPLEVMSAQDFTKGLNVPKSAIKITKGHSLRSSRSDLEVAYQAYRSGDFLTAKSAYRRVLNRRPDSRDARLGVAAIAVMEGNNEKAYRNYHYLLQQNPQDQVVNAALFNLQGNTSGHSNESQLKMSLDQNPNSPQVHFSLGSFYARQARWPEAQQSFFNAFSADKNNGDYAYNLAVSLDQMGQVKPALSYYRTALKLADNRHVSFNTSKVLARIQKLSGIVKN